MLGVVLLYVAIVLISNGIARLSHVDPKSQAIMNLFTGGLSVVCNVIVIICGEVLGSRTDFYAAATGLLFGFTYLYVALNGIFNLDQRLYGWYSLFVAITAIPAGMLSWADRGINNIAMAIIWWLWAALWFTGWVETVLKINLGRSVGALAIFEGIVTAWIPGFMMIAGWWH